MNGALSQIQGSAGCFTEEGIDGCSTGRVIYGAHAIIFDHSERVGYLASDRTDRGGIAIFAHDPASGRLQQLPGAWGCLAPTDLLGCTVYRRTGGIHYLVITRDQQFA